MFSVVVPAYNAEECLARCINSILRQSYDRFEIIIVNDGSTDGTLEQAEKFSDERIRVITQKNAGVSCARNTGIVNAKYPYICFLDADDEWYKDHLSALKDAISAFPEKLFFVTFNHAELLDGSIIEQFDAVKEKEPFYVEDFLQYEFANNLRKCFFTGAVCAHRSAFEKYGLFEEGKSISEDEDMWNRIMLYEGKVIIPRVTVLRHRDHSQLTRRPTAGAPYLFNSRVDGYLSDPSLSEKKKEELKRLYNIMELSSIRSLIVHGRKREAAGRLKKIDRRYISPKKYYETYVSFLIPSAVMKKRLLGKNKNYFK